MPDSRQLLEFDSVIGIILGYAKTFPGRELVSGLKPLSQAEIVTDELSRVRAMRDHVRISGPLEFTPVEDIRESVANSVKPGFLLDAFAILEIGKALTTYDRNAKALETDPELSRLFPRNSVASALPARIARVLDGNGNVLDGASDELRRIRKRRGSIHGDIRKKLGSLMESQSLQDVLQDRIVTVRDGRYVIPLRSQSRNSLKSELHFIIHSYSKTGETAFVEPESVIGLNNEIVEIQEAELEEIRRILTALTAEIGLAAGDISAIWDALGRMECVHARARFALDCRCSFPEILPDRAVLTLKRATHPLLGRDSVPVTLEIGNEYQGLVISGPNAGGKTVTLKIAGLLTLMALSAIPLPADDVCRVGLFETVLAEIGDDQSISENLSSFSGHIRNISRILEQSGPRALVLVDEIASSTEPHEGEAIGRAVIRKLLDTGARFVVTTHFSGIKELGFSDTRLRNAFMEFDEERLAPLYRLNTGGTGSSYALKVARKYGLPDAVISDAEEFLLSRTTDTDKLLKSLEDERNALFRRKGIVEGQIGELRNMKDRYERLLRELETRKEKADQKGAALLRKDLDDALREIGALKNELKKNRVEDVKKARDTIEYAQAVLEETERERLEKTRKRPAQIRPGDRVFVGGFGREGSVETVRDEKLKVRIGIMSVIVDKSDIFEAQAAPDKPRSGTWNMSETLHALPTVLDLRGMLLEEALKTVDKAMDLAVMNGAGGFSIIHGKGEGILRKGVWDYLKKSDAVKSFEYARPEDGGEGKTIVALK